MTKTKAKNVTRSWDTGCLQQVDKLTVLEDSYSYSIWLMMTNRQLTHNTSQAWIWLDNIMRSDSWELKQVQKEFQTLQKNRGHIWWESAEAFHLHSTCSQVHKFTKMSTQKHAQLVWWQHILYTAEVTLAVRGVGGSCNRGATHSYDTRMT